MRRLRRDLLSEPAFACRTIRRFPSGDGEELVLIEPSGRSFRASSAALDVASQCREFRSLRAHAERIRVSGNYARTALPVLESVLIECAKSGILIPEEEIKRRIGQ